MVNIDQKKHGTRPDKSPGNSPGNSLEFVSKEKALEDIASMTRQVEDLMDLVNTVPLESFFKDYIHHEQRRNRLRKLTFVSILTLAATIGTTAYLFHKGLLQAPATWVAQKIPPTAPAVPAGSTTNAYAFMSFEPFFPEPGLSKAEPLPLSSTRGLQAGLKLSLYEPPVEYAEVAFSTIVVAQADAPEPPEVADPVQVASQKPEGVEEGPQPEPVSETVSKPVSKPVAESAGTAPSNPPPELASTVPELRTRLPISEDIQLKLSSPSEERIARNPTPRPVPTQQEFVPLVPHTEKIHFENIVNDIENIVGDIILELDTLIEKNKNAPPDDDTPKG